MEYPWRKGLKLNVHLCVSPWLSRLVSPSVLYRAEIHSRFEPSRKSKLYNTRVVYEPVLYLIMSISNVYLVLF